MINLQDAVTFSEIPGPWPDTIRVTGGIVLSVTRHVTLPPKGRAEGMDFAKRAIRHSLATDLYGDLREELILLRTMLCAAWPLRGPTEVEMLSALDAILEKLKAG